MALRIDPNMMLSAASRPLTAADQPISYAQYHYESLSVGDVDPSYSMLRYVCDRFELNQEQRYWLAYLYATCYCGATAFYIYNEFPDFENVNVERLERWWAANRQRLYFQTDRRWVRSRNQWCDMFRSYRKLMGGSGQQKAFEALREACPYATYDAAWKLTSGLYQFGRFALFLYLEAVHVVTGFAMKPRTMSLKGAESCRNGLAFAIGLERLNTHGTGTRLLPREESFLQEQFDKLTARMQAEDPRNTVWNIETTLCAYKKYRLGKRWVGFYLDRQAQEIQQMSAAVTDGVCWDLLWEYRRETFLKDYLKELRG